MSPKWIKVSSCACFIIFSGVLFTFSTLLNGAILVGHQAESRSITATFSNPEIQGYLNEMSKESALKMKTPSLESFIRASTAMEDQEQRLSGLAVFLNLTNACQPLADVSKAKIQVNKIALIRLVDETVCPLQGLVEQAQNAGYSVVIFSNCPYSLRFDNNTQLQDKLLIPILCGMDVFYSTNYSSVNIGDLDRTYVQIAIIQPAEDLEKMRRYLGSLYFWFLLGPLITLEWLKRRKKLCCMSGGHQAEGDRVPEKTTVESGLNAAAAHGDTQRNYSQEAEYEQTGGETQPLLPILYYPFSNGHRRPAAIRRLLTYLRQQFSQLAVGSGYVILIIAALPVGISSGGLSFFRFDQNEIRMNSFLDHLILSHHSLYSPGPFYWMLSLIFGNFLPLWWSPLQIFVFFAYSKFACKTTWTVPANFSKFIRSDWFSSNMYLLILGVVVPYCSVIVNSISGNDEFEFAYFVTYNTVCTICNLLFIIILNRHKFITRYVFYISVCMIFAYIESDIVAVFYFMLNSNGSLANLKLTALRTVAIGLTLTLSLSSSMHIIRKLTKPRESVFEGLGEK